MIVWIDKKSVLLVDGRTISAGEIVPPGRLSPARIDMLLIKNKIEIHGDPVNVFDNPEPQPELENPKKKSTGKKSKKGKIKNPIFDEE